MLTAFFLLAIASIYALLSGAPPWQVYVLAIAAAIVCLVWEPRRR